MYNKLLYGTIGKEAVRRLSHRLTSKPLAAPFLQTRIVVVRPQHDQHILRNKFPLTKSAFNTDFIRDTRGFSTHSSAWTREGWLAWLNKNKMPIGLGFMTLIHFLALTYFPRENLPSVVEAGDPVLHQPAREVNPGEIGSERIQKVIDDLVNVMRKENLISLSAPQIGVPLQIIALDKFPIARPPKEDYEAEDKRPFDLLVIVNPKLKQKSSKKGFLFENCVSVPKYIAAVERFLEVEVTGMNRYGQPINVDASGWHACVLQHECDHLVGALYLDKMVKQPLICIQRGSEECILKTVDDMEKGYEEK